MKIIIFCGGYGTRMWPASRKSYPKQFFPIIGGKSFFEHTLHRFEKAYSPSDIIISTEKTYAHFIDELAPEIPKENIIIEPERRDNLAAIALVTAICAKRFPNEVVFFSWSDHLVKKESEFLKYVSLAGEYALNTGTPVSINEYPTFPNIYDGWLKYGGKVDDFKGQHLYQIEKFIEKPNLQTAKRLFKSDGYLIHTGYGAWRLDRLSGYFKTYATESYNYAETIADVWGTESYEEVLKECYAKIEKNSIDYGLFEKIPANERLTLAVDTGWQDVGTWQLMFESLATDPEQNLIEGEGKATFLDANGNLVVSPKGKMISVIGLSNMAIIDTPTGLLVSPLENTSRVKELFAILEKDNPDFVN